MSISVDQRISGAMPRQLLIRVLTLLIAGPALSVGAIAAEDTCTEQGGTAYCIGPDVGPFRYQVSPYSGDYLVQGASEAETIAAFERGIRNRLNPCELSFVDSRPPEYPIPAGAGQMTEGDYSAALIAGVGQYRMAVWALSTERYSERIPLKYSGTYPASGPEACTRNFQIVAYVYRERQVGCPGGFGGPFRSNAITQPTDAYCYRVSTSRNPFKNQGRQPAQCANPINSAMGTKFQEEVDYSVGGGSDLAFIRYYNSHIANYNAWYTDPKFNLGPNWRSNYDRLIRFSDSSLFPAAYVFRQDGQTLYFKLSGGGFTPEADIADRLTRLVVLVST